MKIKIIYFSLLLSIPLLFLACKKKKDEVTTPLTIRTLPGIWEETPNQSYARRMVFLDGGKFVMTLGDGNNYMLTLNGNYKTSGETLEIKITEKIEKQGAAAAVRTDENFDLYQNATFSIKNNILTLKYISYPADAPVQTEMKLNFKLPPG